MKTCSACHQPKPLSEFGEAKENKDGLCGRCRECVREYLRAYNQRPEVRARAKVRRDALSDDEQEARNAGQRARYLEKKDQDAVAKAAWAEANSEKMKAFFRNRLQLYMFLKNRLSRMNRISVFLMNQGILRNSNFIQRDEHDVLIDYYTHQADYPPAWENAWEVTKALLLAIRDEAARMQAGFLVVLINYDVLVYDDLWQEALETYPFMAEVDWDLGKANRLINEFCEANRISSLDLLAQFREEAARTGEPLHIPVEGHWNRRGHRLASELVYKKIVDARMIPH